MSEKFKKLEKLLGYEFKDKSLLKAALSHKSARSGVNNERLEFLGDAVLDLVVGEYLIMSISERKSGGDKKPSLLSDALEAIFGAIYLESGLECAKSVFVPLVESEFKNIDKDMLKDYKTRLKEITQERRGLLPK